MQKPEQALSKLYRISHTSYHSLYRQPQVTAKVQQVMQTALAAPKQVISHFPKPNFQIKTTWINPAMFDAV